MAETGTTPGRARRSPRCWTERAPILTGMRLVGAGILLLALVGCEATVPEAVAVNESQHTLRTEDRLLGADRDRRHATGVRVRRFPDRGVGGGRIVRPRR